MYHCSKWYIYMNTSINTQVNILIFTTRPWSRYYYYPTLQMTKWNLLKVLNLKGGYSSPRKLKVRGVSEPTQDRTARKRWSWVSNQIHQAPEDVLLATKLNSLTLSVDRDTDTHTYLCAHTCKCTQTSTSTRKVEAWWGQTSISCFYTRIRDSKVLRAFLSDSKRIPIL